MIKLGNIIAAKFSKYLPECKEILDVYVEEGENMKKANIQEMEDLYLNAGVFKKRGLEIDPDDYKYEGCLDIMNFVTLPVSVQILIKQYNVDQDKKHLERIKDGFDETLSLFD